MCVSGVRSGAVSCECVRVSCEWASRRSSVVRREVFSFALRFVRDSEVFVSSFEFEFSRRSLNSYFEVDSRIRFLEFSKSRFEVEFRIRLFRFVALFDFSKSIVKFDFSNFNFRFEFSIQVHWFFVSNLSSKFSFRCSIRLLEFRRSIRLLEFRVFDSNFRFKCLEFDDSKVSPNFEFVLIYSTSRTLMIIKFSKLSFSKSHSSFEFLIELFNFRSQVQFDDSINDWRPQLFSHDRSRFALVATRALRALFVRKILVKRQFTFSLYFGIIEL